MDDFTPLNLFGSDKADNASDEANNAASDNKEGVSLENVAKEDNADKNAEAEQEEGKLDETATETVIETIEIEKMADENTIDKNETVEDETQPDELDKVLKMQQQILSKIEALDSLFNARIMHTDHEERIVDQMHKELQKYKEDMYAQLIRPILLDVIEIRDSIMRMTATYLAKPEGEQNIPNKTFADYAYDLQDILEKNSVEIYRSKSGDDFTPIRQRVIKKVVTADEALHGKVAESLSCGYSYNGRTISAEKITAYYYEKNIKDNENSEVSENG